MSNNWIQQRLCYWMDAYMMICLKKTLDFNFFLAFVKMKCSSQISRWNIAVTTKPHAFEANNPDWEISFILSGWYCSTLIVQLHWNCDSLLPLSIPHPSVSIQTSKSWSFWNSVCIYWSDNILWDILDIFLRIFAPLGVSWTHWRHKTVITKIIIDHKLISKVMFTAAGFPVLEDHLWLFPFPISTPTLSLLPQWRRYSFAKLKNGWWPILMVALIL